MLESRNVSGDDLGAIPADQKSKVLNYYARQTIYPGQLLQTNLLRTEPAPRPRTRPRSAYR